jgi:hypothetical protein
MIVLAPDATMSRGTGNASATSELGALATGGVAGPAAQAAGEASSAAATSVLNR